MYVRFCMLNLTFNDINSFKNYINASNCEDFVLNLSNMNIFESIKFVVLSSAYYSQKFPEDKLKCVVNSEDVKSLISSFDVKNLEFV